MVASYPPPGHFQRPVMVLLLVIMITPSNGSLSMFQVSETPLIASTIVGLTVS
jgi:hypothetical protein